jgi:V/A-type H+-transporting ATPase subunit A
MSLLQKESELMEIVQLVGPDALPERDRLILEAARYVRESFLQQSAFSEVDTFCPVERQLKMLGAIMEYYELAKLAMERGVKLEQIVSLSSPRTLPRMKMVSGEEFDGFLSRLSESMKKEFEATSTKAGA